MWYSIVVTETSCAERPKRKKRLTYGTNQALIFQWYCVLQTPYESNINME